MFHLASGSVNVCLIQLFGCCLKVLFRRSLKQLEVACCVLAQMVDCGGPEIRTEMRTQTILLSFLSLHRDLPSKPWHEGHFFFSLCCISIICLNGSALEISTRQVQRRRDKPVFLLQKSYYATAHFAFCCCSWKNKAPFSCISLLPSKKIGKNNAALILLYFLPRLVGSMS